MDVADLTPGLSRHHPCAAPQSGSPCPLHGHGPARRAPSFSTVCVVSQRQVLESSLSRWVKALFLAPFAASLCVCVLSQSLEQRFAASFISGRQLIIKILRHTNSYVTFLPI